MGLVATFYKTINCGCRELNASRTRLEQECASRKGRNRRMTWMTSDLFVIATINSRSFETSDEKIAGTCGDNVFFSLVLDPLFFGPSLAYQTTQQRPELLWGRS
ncbi:hypothetical protein RRG08_023978 [Elysia crispata]|uniref:Uncharacterized protein n=1 Tax=Elysia crispata TaxID=231223 RepID=A0AAE0YN93_9GAST|nr:hypothetical protein RRG08_023978 [Elysia crispata]